MTNLCSKPVTDLNAHQLFIEVYSNELCIIIKFYVHVLVESCVQYFFLVNCYYSITNSLFFFERFASAYNLLFQVKQVLFPVAWWRKSRHHPSCNL